jgi:hypothetical protein
MPTISQLPAAASVSATDQVPISQAGDLRAVSVGTLLESVQPTMTLASTSLLGRISVGSGGPEQVDVGTGLHLSGGTLVATGMEVAGFPVTPNLALASDLVISNQGSPMLMQTSLLRGLFSAGSNVGIDANGVISATGSLSTTGTVTAEQPIAALPVVAELSAQDLVAASQSGTNCAITYGNLLDGITIDQAQTAKAASDTDTTWVAQGSNVMASQTFAAVWTWIANKLPTYTAPVVEITTNTTLDNTLHNGRLLICSQPITLIPLTADMGNGFQCSVLNASTGNLTLGPGFVTSSGNLALTPWQSATLSCVSYSAGTIAFAAMPAAPSTVTLPGQVQTVTASGATASTVALSWQAPSSGGLVASYIVQYRVTGTTSWTSSPSVAGAVTYQLTGLQAATSYDITVLAQNASGTGAASSILTLTTAGSSQATTPAQVTGLTATPTSSSAIQLSWAAQSGASAATSFTVQYRVTGSSAWTSSVTGITTAATAITPLQPATSYDFEVTGTNAAGTGPASATVTAVTQAATQSVSSITWNLLPSGPYTHGSGAIGVNAQVSPASAAIQFGFSQSAAVPPATWTAATPVNSNLWGAYLAAPATAGTWYVWAEGLDGSARIVSSASFVVQ